MTARLQGFRLLKDNFDSSPQRIFFLDVTDAHGMRIKDKGSKILGVRDPRVLGVERHALFSPVFPYSLYRHPIRNGDKRGQTTPFDKLRTGFDYVQGERF